MNIFCPEEVWERFQILLQTFLPFSFVVPSVCAFLKNALNTWDNLIL